ncbi:hypothetical protein [Sphingomonas sp. Leaf257]|uniref:hypothetical protein n=1 Tax=Sphingomonas sp. Leaf257 TaxID=1736309 RepID=UPI000AC7498A|nr:hypothetical protein [Sphingomonas sp. Leaf257]
MGSNSIELERRRAAARAGGGEKRVAAQHAKGKLTARERLDVLLVVARSASRRSTPRAS